MLQTWNSVFLIFFFGSRDVLYYFWSRSFYLQKHGCSINKKEVDNCCTLGQSHFARSHRGFDLKTGIFMQAILKQLGKETDIYDDDEVQGYQKLQNLYNSTRETKVCHEVLFFYCIDVPICNSANIIIELSTYQQVSHYVICSIFRGRLFEVLKVLFQQLKSSWRSVSVVLPSSQ